MIVDLGCGSGRSLRLEPRERRVDGRASTWRRTSPRKRSTRRGSRARRSAAAAVCRRRVPKGYALDVFEHLSPDGAGGGARARSRGSSRRRAPVRLLARAEELVARRRPEGHQRDSRAASSGSGWSTCGRSACASRDHLNPLADIPDLERTVRPGRVPHRAHPLLHAAHRRLRREHPRCGWRSAPSARGGARDAADAAAAARDWRRRTEQARLARTSAKRTLAARGALYSPAARGHVRDDAGRAGSSAASAQVRSSCCSSARRERPPTEMRILYCAIDQRVPGTLGGSTHVRAVAEGLAALGHDVHALVGRGDGPFPEGAVHWHAMGAPLGRAQLRVLRAASGTAAGRHDTARPRHGALPQLRRRGRAGRAFGACAARPRGECAGHRLPGIAARPGWIARSSSSRCAAGASGSWIRRDSS